MGRAGWSRTHGEAQCRQELCSSHPQDNLLLGQQEQSPRVTEAPLLRKSPIPAPPAPWCRATLRAAWLPAINRPRTRPPSAGISGSRQQLAAAAPPPPPRSHDSAQASCPPGRPRSPAPTTHPGPLTEPPQPGMGMAPCHHPPSPACCTTSHPAALRAAGAGTVPSCMQGSPSPEAGGSLPSCVLVLGGSAAAGSQ